ncbi:MAG TPA: energy transducer TonB, partial [Chromatiales bacterium]|nr:energy transducer TonB [Chromatiales bacterium]
APQPPAKKASRPVDAPPARPRPEGRPKEILAVQRRKKREALPLTAETAPERSVTASQILASTEAEIARLTRRIEKRSSAYARRPRRRAINASTKEFRYAAYLEAWRRKIERIGNLNYPEEARRKGLYGNLVLHVAVRADGSVEQIRVVRSSGHKLLDEAAMRIVRLAAPFAPFPENIRKETDILDITRTWQFLRSNRLGWAKN